MREVVSCFFCLLSYIHIISLCWSLCYISLSYGKWTRTNKLVCIIHAVY